MLKAQVDDSGLKALKRKPRTPPTALMAFGLTVGASAPQDRPQNFPSPRRPLRLGYREGALWYSCIPPSQLEIAYRKSAWITEQIEAKDEI